MTFHARSSMPRLLGLLAVLALLTGGGQRATGAPASPLRAPAAAATTAGHPLADLLNTDGTVRLDSGYSGSLDPAGWQLQPGSGAPRFVPAAPQVAGDENWDSRFYTRGADGGVSAAVISGTTLYIGGYFRHIGRVAANHIAAWNGSTWAALGAGTDSMVNALAVSGTTLYAGGYFHTAGGVPANHIVAWNGSAWAALGAGTDNDVLALAVSGSALYTGGRFTTAGDKLSSRFGIWTQANSPSCTVTFSDVQPSDYFYQPVQYLACHGVISGYADGTFRPGADTTRGQLSKIIVLAYDLPIQTPTGGDYTFADNLPGSPFFPYLETTAAHGIVSGYNCGGVNPQTGASEPCDPVGRPYYRPGNNVTRGQLSKIVVLTAAQIQGWALLNPPTARFHDVPPNSTFYPYIETAVCHRILSGESDGNFRPNNNATRGQISKIVYLAVTDNTTGCGP